MVRHSPPGTHGPHIRSVALSGFDSRDCRTSLLATGHRMPGFLHISIESQKVSAALQLVRGGFMEFAPSVLTAGVLDNCLMAFLLPHFSFTAGRHFDSIFVHTRW